MSYHRKSEQLVKVTHQMLPLEDESQSVVKLSIHPNAKISERWLDDANNVVRTKETPIVGSEVEVGERQFIHERGKSFSTILEMLPYSLQISANALNRLILKIDADARWAVLGDMNSRLGSNMWMICVNMEITTTWFSDGRRRNRRNEALEEVRMKGGDDAGGEICAICLGGIPAGLYVTRTPCSHLFHDRCIIRWLNKSRSCPMCRFEIF